MGFTEYTAFEVLTQLAKEAGTSTIKYATTNGGWQAFLNSASQAGYAPVYNEAGKLVSFVSKAWTPMGSVGTSVATSTGANTALVVSNSTAVSTVAGEATIATTGATTTAVGGSTIASTVGTGLAYGATVVAGVAIGSVIGTKIGADAYREHQEFFDTIRENIKINGVSIKDWDDRLNYYLFGDTTYMDSDAIETVVQSMIDMGVYDGGEVVFEPLVEFSDVQETIDISSQNIRLSDYSKIDSYEHMIQMGKYLNNINPNTPDIELYKNAIKTIIDTLNPQIIDKVAQLNDGYVINEHNIIWRINSITSDSINYNAYVVPDIEKWLLSSVETGLDRQALTLVTADGSALTFCSHSSRKITLSDYMPVSITMPFWSDNSLRFSKVIPVSSNYFGNYVSYYNDNVVITSIGTSAISSNKYDYITFNESFTHDKTAGEQLREKFPTWYDNAKTLTNFIPNPDYDPSVGNDPVIETETTLLPIKIPSETDIINDNVTVDDSTTDTNKQGKTDESTVADDYTNNEQIVDDATNDLPSDTTKQPTDNTGDTPIVAVPTWDLDVGFVKLYNPTTTQLKTFNNWLWSSNFVDTLVKLFQDPMQAIIGLHKIYATPSRGSDDTIVVGTIDSNVTSRTVNNQYITIDCGTQELGLYYGNVYDYTPFTQVQCYLPFIGIVNLDTNEVMCSKINITYKVDVLTGDCLCTIKIMKDKMDSILYTFNGNCAVQIPITNVNYTNILTKTIGAVAGIASAVATSGATLPLAVGATANAVGGAVNGISVNKSGMISGNVGSMGIKKPYLIINRQISADPSNFNKFYGNTDYKTVKLNTCTGFTQVMDVHVTIATSNVERNLIETQLKDGVII